MKANKSPEETEVTPSKKKLKQARLPFMLLSETSPKPTSPVTRKRKLSNAEVETVTKIGKISKENDAQELVVISDDESNDSQKKAKDDKIVNPYVKLVNVAFKKKQQKSKKKRGKKTNSINKPDEKETSENEDKMDVDEPEVQEKTAETKVPIENGTDEVNKEDGSVILLEDSNNSSDNKIQSKTNEPDNTQESPEKSNNEEPEVPKNDTESETSTENTAPSDKPNQPEKEKSPNEELSEAVNVTPKRSSRSLTREQNRSLNKSPTSSLNESVSSDLTTPKHSRSSSVTNQGDESLNDSMSAMKNLTPKQLQKKLELAKKKEEREKEKQEREKKRQQEKDEKNRQRLEKEEQRKKEKEEKEEQKRKEKEEKEKQRELEKKIREEKEEQKKKEREEKEEQRKKEKEEKEEQRRKEKEAKEEEKRKKQEALELEKQEQELKMRKSAQAFVNFFVPKQKSEKDQTIVGSVSKNNMLSSFTLKLDMRLAPTIRTELNNSKKDKLDHFIKDQKCEIKDLYIKQLKDGIAKPLRSGKTWPLTDKDDDDDVMIIEDELPPIDGANETVSCEEAPREKLRPKLLSFHENRRPPYWGTWRKKSAFVKPRKPFGQDEKQLDYEVDSDEEWEEEQEGESIDGSAAGSDDEQDGDEYEVDNEVFVPHGYLSDEEATMEDDDVLSLSPETQKARLKHLEDEFESEMKKPTEKLKPRMYGPIWETSEGDKPEKCVDALWNYFTKLAMIIDDPTPFLQPSSEPEDQDKKRVKKKKPTTTENSDQNTKTEKKKKTKSEEKEGKPKALPKVESKKSVPDKKNQPGINMFLTKLKSS